MRKATKEVVKETEAKVAKYVFRAILVLGGVWLGFQLLAMALGHLMLISFG